MWPHWQIPLAILAVTCDTGGKVKPENLILMNKANIPSDALLSHYIFSVLSSLIWNSVQCSPCLGLCLSLHQLQLTGSGTSGSDHLGITGVVSGPKACCSVLNMEFRNRRHSGKVQEEGRDLFLSTFS